ncbi:MAG: hypothetical protein RL095_293 [Verrucomicrobiota bacterium]
MSQDKWLDDHACAIFGRSVLEILEESEDWSADTLEAIAQVATELRLRKLDSADFERAAQPYPGPELYLPEPGTGIIVASEYGDMHLMIEGDTAYVYFEAPRKDDVSRAEVVISRPVDEGAQVAVRFYDLGGEEPVADGSFRLSPEGKWCFE